MSTAILLCNMGGPTAIEDVKPYLENIFLDPDIIDIPFGNKFRISLARFIANRREKKSRKIFEYLGGKSPLPEISSMQAKKLEEALKDEEEEIRVFPAMRYWYPFTEDVWQKVKEAGFDKILAISLYAFYSSTTTGSLINILNHLNSKEENPKDLQIIDRFGNEPLFIEAMAEDIKNTVRQSYDDENNSVNILLSAHSIPMSRIRKGDPYQSEIESSVEQLKNILPDNYITHLSYQSKIGPIKWLGPSTEEKVRELAAQNIDPLWIYPYGFVADNSETIYEMGKQYRDAALESGIENFYRIPALNDSESFINLLKEITLKNVHSLSKDN